MPAHDGTQRVLLIDDDELIVDVFKLMLSKRYEVDCALDGDGGLKLMRDGGPYAVIICDLQLPDMDGQAIYETMMSEGREKIVQSMLFCTGGTIDARSNAFLERMGPTRVLNKPCRVDELFTAIDRMAAMDTPAPPA